MNIGTYYCVLIKNYIALLEFVIRQSIDRRNTMSPKTAKNDLEIYFYVGAFGGIPPITAWLVGGSRGGA